MMKTLLLLWTLALASAPSWAQQLTGQDCGFRQKCIFNEKGDLLYWVTEYHHWDSAARTAKNVFITGYADIKHKQEEYNQWVDLKYPSKYDHSFDIVPSGRLNIRTMRIPAMKARLRIMLIHSSFQLDCHRGVAERLAGGDAQVELMRKTCSLNILEYAESLDPSKGRVEILFPNDELKYRADIIRDGYLATQAYDAVVRQLKPLTEEWNRLNDPDWRRLGETDHFEITQVPAGFMDKLGEAEFHMESRVAFAEDMEAIARRTAP